MAQLDPINEELHWSRDELHEAERAARLEEEKARNRLDFLARASRILARSLDYERTFRRVARLAVPYISDWCAVDLVQEDGSLKRVAARHVQPAKAELLRELLRRYPPDPETARGAPHAVRTGRTEFFREIPAAVLEREARDPEHMHLISQLGLKSAIVVPLKGRERILGAITFANADSGRLFDEEDVALVEELAGRATLAIENAQLYQEARALNEELERRVKERTAALKAANLELKMEVAERRRVEERQRRQAERTAALVRTAAQLNATLDLPRLLDTICREAVRALNVPVATVSLYDEKRKQLILAEGYGLPEWFRERVAPLPSSVYDAYRQEMGPIVVVSDIRGLSDLPNAELYEALDVRTTVSASMLHKGKLVGRLNVASVSTPRHFTEGELALLQGLADQAALAIQNARLLGQVQAGQERLRIMAQRVVSAQEDERRRLSKELHDEAGQTLTALKINLGLIRNNLPDSADGLRQQLGDLLEWTEETMQRLRLLAYDLRPPALESLSFHEAMENLTRDFAGRTGLAIHYEGQELPPLPDTTAASLYRFVQEALTNVVKHAQAGEVQVELHLENQILTLGVSDNGRGFVVPEVISRASVSQNMGLAGMQERLELIGGQLKIDSRPGRGTRLVATVKLERVNEPAGSQVE
ncbi:MAG: GAF domain-containing sensor histidine kinase [Chloroflexi bacterium]|nr:GAF domain-containing sensor histidine kinase [Chloroflexota bacterium]MCI0576466.1 GAF domain-containing sensor histidine kinase [Chloroflexota bacterium]MCI0649558.1 GAF domain-containing sensor histidine kinase [Chloroflexota bacterium]MCI0729366.1 GAF domain-containing sensor histidine kinase [Chloroflexota bacterium]